MVEHRGAQRDIFSTGRASRSIAVTELPASTDLHALGPCEHLDGEITVLRGKPYVSRVGGNSYFVRHDLDHGAVFLVWTLHARWTEVPVPASVRSYLELQSFIHDEARARGIDTAQAFPFLMTGTPAELTWHINVDRTGGQPITPQLFRESKETYVLKREDVDIVGFYSQRHDGIFISTYAPALRADRGEKNFMHLHFVSRTSTATGHIDDVGLDGAMTLRLPA